MILLTPTHIVFSVTTFLALSSTASVSVISVAVICAVLPDLDTRQSLAGKALPFLSTPIAYQFGHRTLTHSLLFQAVIGAIAVATLPKDYAMAILCGLVSHAFADMLTQSGVCWFWPSRARCVLPGSSKYRFETGSWAELAFACSMAALSFLLVWVNNSTAGTGGVIRSAIGDIAAARKQYDEQKGSYSFTLRLKGRDNETLELVEGQYPVIASWAAKGFLIQKDNQALPVCSGESCKVHPERAVLVSQSAISATTFTIKRNRFSAESLQTLIADYEDHGDVFVSGRYNGSAEANGVTVKQTNDSVSLYYATAGDLPKSGVMRSMDLRVQVRHAPRTVVPQVPILDHIEKKLVLDPLIEKWL